MEDHLVFMENHKRGPGHKGTQIRAPLCLGNHDQKCCLPGEKMDVCGSHGLKGAAQEPKISSIPE